MAPEALGNLPRVLKRLFKFPQMDFELAVWEMSNLIVAPKKVARSMYYNKQTRNQWHQPDPSFLYLLALLLVPTGIAWGVAYADTVLSTVTTVLSFVLLHLFAFSLVAAWVSYKLIGRFLSLAGPGVSMMGPGSIPGRRRNYPGASVGTVLGSPGGDQIEFGYCFDVAIRAFFPVWVFLYVVQFFLMPVISRDRWISIVVGNALYLVAFSYYVTVFFMGYNVLPFLHRTTYLLLPIPILASLVLLLTVAGFSLPRHFAPILWSGASLRSSV